MHDRCDTVLKLSSAEEEKNSKSLRRTPESLITYSTLSQEKVMLPDNMGI